MSPRTPSSSTSRRDQLRASELQSPENAARNLNDILRDLQKRLEALERKQFVDISVVVDAGGTMSPVTLAAPAWPVRDVGLARGWNATLGIPAPYLRIGWQQDGKMLTVAPWIGDVSASTRYDLTLRLEG